MRLQTDQVCGIRVGRGRDASGWMDSVQWTGFIESNID